MLHDINQHQVINGMNFFCSNIFTRCWSRCRRFCYYDLPIEVPSPSVFDRIIGAGQGAAMGMILICHEIGIGFIIGSLYQRTGRTVDAQLCTTIFAISLVNVPIWGSLLGYLRPPFWQEE
jgi:hypothetical protein